MEEKYNWVTYSSLLKKVSTALASCSLDQETHFRSCVFILIAEQATFFHPNLLLISMNILRLSYQLYYYWILKIGLF